MQDNTGRYGETDDLFSVRDRVLSYDNIKLRRDN